MAKIVFTFFEANVEDKDEAPFIQKIEETLQRFAGKAYHFRYYLEEPTDITPSKPKKDSQLRPIVNRFSKFY